MSLQNTWRNSLFTLLAQDLHWHLAKLLIPLASKRGEDYADEWAKRPAKLAKQAKEAVRKFNEDSAAAAAEASTSKKAMPKKAT